MAARRWQRSVWLLGAAAGGALAGAALFSLQTLFSGGDYLCLQARSDPVHRFALFCAPACLAGLVLAWALGELAHLHRWIRLSGRIAVGTLLGLLFGTLSFTLRFDRALERQGLAGQLLAHGAVPSEPGSGPAMSGPWAERSAEEPNLATGALPNGDVLTLDRRTLARKTESGAFRWNRPRPGPPPAWLVLLHGRVAVLAGPGPDFEDDAVIAAVDIQSGRGLWELHLLGRRVLPPIAEGDRLAVLVQRPSGASLHLLDWRGPAVLRAVRTSAPISHPPRIRAGRLEAIADGGLLRWTLPDLDGPHAVPLACEDPAGFEVACEAGRVVAWSAEPRRGQRAAEHVRQPPGQSPGAEEPAPIR
ncbi:MAG: hypothetical protein JXR96_15480 [Deltaproteobacteria bacterium]|nr:hypothetical protein [Deltaproteobacteria bacterium]